jgi:hypothetical protein
VRLALSAEPEAGQVDAGSNNIDACGRIVARQLTVAAAEAALLEAVVGLAADGGGAAAGAGAAGSSP